MAWDAALKMTKVELELLSDEAMYSFIERSIRGGVSQISKRLAKANIDGCKDHDQKDPNVYLIYLDANNLYGWAMSQELPTHGFRWLTAEEIDSIIISELSENGENGWIFEVSLLVTHLLIYCFPFFCHILTYSLIYFRLI